MQNVSSMRYCRNIRLTVRYRSKQIQLRMVLPQNIQDYLATTSGVTTQVLFKENILLLLYLCITSIDSDVTSCFDFSA